LKNDRRVFNSLVENQKRIETEGNQLDEASNVQRSMTDAQALEIIKAQADKKGPISDALNLAAREFAEGRSLAETSRTVADAVRRAVDGGDVDGRTVSLERIDADVAEEGNRLAAGPERLDEFDEPNGKGSQDQADAAETTLREETEITEAAQPDVALREDLGRIIDEGATPEQIDAHPAVTDALERAMAIPLTKEADGYGGDAWRAGREFRFGDETVVGYEAGVQRLYENAKRLGWENDGKTFPGQIEQGRRATIMLGPPASGKSYFANKVAQARNAAIVDSDEAKKVLPEYDDGIGATAVHAESTTLAEEVLRKVISNGDNFVIPRTGKALSEIEPIIAQLKENGYQVDIILMQVSADTAYKRMISRFIATGRLIPPDVVRGVGNNPQITYNAVKSKADRYAQIENESPIDSAKGVLDEGPDSPLRDVDLRLRRGSEVSGREPYRLDATEPTPQGQQTLVEGVEPITDATRAQAAVDAPLTGGNRPMDEGLFDTAARGQGDLLDMDIPVGQRVDADGNMVAENQTVREMLQEFDQDKNMIKRLEGCV
jgi:predicted ABC-type ATPase